nr:putative integron gene cassette protein [uncultured bacterium]
MTSASRLSARHCRKLHQCGCSPRRSHEPRAKARRFSCGGNDKLTLQRPSATSGSSPRSAKNLSTGLLAKAIHETRGKAAHREKRAFTGPPRQRATQGLLSCSAMHKGGTE